VGVLRVKVGGQWIDIPSGGSSGVAGPAGPPGPTAVSADPGNTAILGSDGLIYLPAGASQSYVHLQPVAALVWTITHPLTFMPGVTIVNALGVQTEGQVRYVSPSQIEITFTAPQDGQAFLS